MPLISILITTDEFRGQALPDRIEENISSLKACYADQEHIFFDGNMCRAFIEDHFGGEVRSAFDSLKPFAYKCDLARYCIIHQLGGIYADLSIYFFSRWLPPHSAQVFPDHRLFVFRDFPHSTWCAYNGAFYAPKGHKALAKAIELVCANVRTRAYGANSLCPTGPELFGKAIALTCDAGETVTGESLMLELPSHLRHIADARSHCLVSGRSIVAVKRKGLTQTMKEVGVSGANEYFGMWTAKDIYV